MSSIIDLDFGTELDISQQETLEDLGTYNDEEGMHELQVNPLQK